MQLTPVVFRSVNDAGLLKKISEFNSAVAAALTADELNTVSLLLTHVSSPGTIPLDVAAAVDVVHKLLSWPVGQRFPGIDLARLLLTSPACSAHVASRADGVEGMLTAGALVPTCCALAGMSGTPPASPAEQLLALKCLANAFSANAHDLMLLARDQVRLNMKNKR